jgi:hypothetical protein
MAFEVLLCDLCVSFAFLCVKFFFVSVLKLKSEVEPGASLGKPTTPYPR